MLILFLVFLLSGLLFVGLAVPLIRGRVSPNLLYGLRVPATLADERVWYEANRRSGWDLLWLGAALAALALLLPLSEVGRNAYALAWSSVAVVGALAVAVVGWRRANRLREVLDRAADEP